MSTVLADLFVSADGYARGEHSPGYFGYFGPDLERWIDGEMDRPRQELMGRRTYELLAGLPAEARDAGYERMSRQATTVFSRTLGSTAWPGASVEPRDAVEVVRERKASGDLPLRTVGSLSIVRQLVNAGLVDRLRLMVFPLFVGASGAEPAYAGLDETELELVDQRVLDGRILLVEYRPTGTPIP
ncbi:MAG TPA: dihydrofolate reductase family protein [Nocardioides sp.]|nr:dihydrofolate reductase family protein [Nocardioides sp.]